MRRQREVVVEVGGQLQRDYDSKLVDALRAIREENDGQIAASRQKIEEMYARKVLELTFNLTVITIIIIILRTFSRACGVGHNCN